MARPTLYCATLVASLFVVGCSGSARKPHQAYIPPPPDVAEAPPEASVTDDGIQVLVLEQGEAGGEEPTPLDIVEVEYSGWTTDGTLIDSSIKRGRPARFPVDAVIPGFAAAVVHMTPGDKVRVWIPAPLAYGENPRQGAPAGPLVYEIKLLAVDKSLRTPDNLLAPPPDAERTESGIVYAVMREGSGTERPESTSRVRVHYSGWQRDGSMFDSSVRRGQPAEFSLDQVIPGWREGVQQMREGEKTRFWIPAHLAYGERPARPGAPAGDLVFDIELLKILN